jgi:hypothetical protein
LGQSGQRKIKNEMSAIKPLRIDYNYQVHIEPITLAEAKAWLQIDFGDWDNLIQFQLIPEARIESEKASGMLYVQRNVTVSNNKRSERIYPIGPWVSDVTTDETEIQNYTYLAGFNDSNPLPQDLKIAMLKRIATEFAYRQNIITVQEQYAQKSSITTELKYRADLFV